MNSAFKNKVLFIISFIALAAGCAKDGSSPKGISGAPLVVTSVTNVSDYFNQKPSGFVASRDDVTNADLKDFDSTNLSSNRVCGKSPSEGVADMRRIVGSTYIVREYYSALVHEAGDAYDSDETRFGTVNAVTSEWNSDVSWTKTLNYEVNPSNARFTCKLFEETQSERYTIGTILFNNKKFPAVLLTVIEKGSVKCRLFDEEEFKIELGPGTETRTRVSFHQLITPFSSFCTEGNDFYRSSRLILNSGAIVRSWAEFFEKAATE